MLGKGISRLSNWPRIIFKFEKTCRNLQGVYSNTAIVRFKADFRESNDNENKIPGGISSRYEPFTEETVPIFDVEEERQKVDKPLAEKLEQFEGINLQRGATGVIIIEELVDILKREKAVDIFVAKIPPTYRYADYLVIATGKSARHILAMSEFIRKVFKKKMNSDDKVPVLEGKNSKNWMALDLGNIVVHIFSQSAREYYDLETLWSVGPEYDSQSIKKDNENSRILADYSAMLASLTPIMPKK